MERSMIGDRIKHERAARGWTQAELATRSGISEQYIRHLEKNRRPNPTGNTLEALGHAFGLTVDELRRSGPGAETDSPPGKELLAAGVADWRVRRLVAIWPRLTPTEREGHWRRAQRLYAERELIQQATRLLAEIDALNAELDYAEQFEPAQEAGLDAGAEASPARDPGGHALGDRERRGA